jgi:hypothetical protein
MYRKHLANLALKSLPCTVIARLTAAANYLRTILEHKNFRIRPFKLVERLAPREAPGLLDSVEPKTPVIADVRTGLFRPTD